MIKKKKKINKSAQADLKLIKKKKSDKKLAKGANVLVEWNCPAADVLINRNT